MRRWRCYVLALGAIALGGCATKIKIQRQVASKSDLCGIRRIAIGNIVVDGRDAQALRARLAKAEAKSGKGGADASGELTKLREDIRKIEIFEQTIAGKIRQGIQDQYLTYVERNPAQLAAVTREIEEFHDGGTLSKKTLQALQNDRVEGLLFISVTGQSNQRKPELFDESWQDPKDGSMHRAWRRESSLTLLLNVEYRIADARPDSPCGALGSRARMAESEKQTWEVVERGGDTDPTRVIGDLAGGILGGGGSGATKRVDMLPAPQQAIDELAQRSAAKYLRQIQPHWQRGAVEVRSPSTPRGQTALDYALSCEWDKAEEILTETIAAGGVVTADDYYNLAVIKELKGCRHEATTLMEKAVELDSDSDLVKAHAKLLKGQGLGNFEDSGPPASMSDSGLPLDGCPIVLNCPQVSSSPQEAVEGDARTNTELNLWSGPDKKKPLIKKFPQGTAVRVVDDHSNAAWWKLEIRDGNQTLEGWGFHKSIDR